MARNPNGRRRRRWWLALVALVVAVAALAIWALPWAVGTPAGMRMVKERADRILAPGSLSFGSLELSWFGPTRLSRFVLNNHQGQPVLSSPRAVWDRNLWQILFDRPRYGTLTFDGATLDVERKADGTVDIYETIKPLITKNPRLDIAIKIDRAKLRFRSPGLAQPLRAEQTGLDIRIPPAPNPITWQLQLANQTPVAPQAVAPEPGPQKLHINGSYDRWGQGPAPNLSLDIAGNDWPLALALGGVAASGRFSGEVQVRRESARWGMEGRTWIAALDVSGELLAGDHLQLDRAGGTWALAQQAGGWSLSKLDLSAPVGWLRLDGSFPVANGASTKLAGELDLAALASQLPRALRLREEIAIEQGKAKLSVEGRGTAQGQTWQVEANVSDLAARREGQLVQIREPVLLSARLALEEHSFRVERMGLKTAFIDVSAEGSLERGVSLKGNVDLDGLQRSLRQWVDTGNLALAGKGELDGTYRRAGDDFDLRLHTRFEPFGLAGLSRDPFHVDKIELDAQLGGPADVRGLPRSLSSARIALGGGGFTAELTAREKQGATELVGIAQVPFVLADRAGKADARLEGLWSKGKLEINTLRAGLQATDDPKSLHFAWSARGRFEPATGTLVLSPAANPTAPAAIALAPDGFRVAGLGHSDTPLQVDGGFEGSVGAIAQAYADWTGRPQPELGGRWSLRYSARGADEGLNLSGRLDLHDLSWPGPDGTSRHQEPELGAAARAIYRPNADRLDLVEFVFTSPYATLEASGQVAELGGSRHVELKGSLQPDWKRLNTSIALWIEPQARLKGTPRPFWLKAPLASASSSAILAGLEAEAGFDLQEAEFFGMHVGPTPIVVRAKEGRLRFDPIRTTLNGGRLSADPELVLDEDGSLVLTLAPGAAIEGAEVNPEVTRRVLSFVAPVLEQATRARGRVSAKIDRAEVPLVSRAGRTTQVEGKVVFTDLEFTPGPIADQLFDMLGQDRVPTLRLNQPVTLAIVDGRVIQRGLAIPVGRLTQIELEGSVDFQRNLDLTASLPITSAMLGNNPALMGMLGGTRISVPISGTLAHPRIDRERFSAALLGASKTLLQRAAGGGALDLRKLFDRLLDPALKRASPGPLPREERRMLREERKKERQRERELDRQREP